MPPSPKKPTLRSLAEQLGVSKSTVSLALSNSPLLAAETGERIRKTARAAGYTPDAVMSHLLARLRTGRDVRFKGKIAVLSSCRPAPLWDAYECQRRFLAGIEQRARELGYSTERHWLHQPGQSIAALRRILRARGIQGIALAVQDGSAPLPPAALELLAEYPFATTERYPFGRLTHSSTVNHYEAVSVACEQLALRGYRRIGLYVNPATDRFVHGRFTAGYLYHCDFNGLRALPVASGPEPTAAHFRAWFRKHKPDAIITLVSCADVWLRTLGAEPGRDVGLVHLDSTEVSDWAAVDQHFTEVGAACADLVVAQIQRDERGLPELPKLVTIEVGWRDGPTVRPRPRARV